MADQQERIILEAEAGPVIASVGKANKTLDDFEKKGARAGTSIGQAFEKTSEVVIRASDRSRASAERLVASIEKRAALAGKTGSERLIAERDQLIQRLTGEERAIERTRVAYQRLIDAQRETEGSSRNLGATITDFVQNPVQSAGGAVQGFLGRLATAPAIIAGFALAVVGAVKASFDLVSQLGDGAERMGNMADRTGLTVAQIDKLQAMAKIAGVNIDSLESGARALSEGLADVSGGGDRAREALRRLGVQVYGTAGNQREMGQVMLDVLKSLGGVESQAERVALATALLGRGALEILPLINNFKELEATAARLGFGLDEELLKRLGKAGDQIDELGLRWEKTKRRLSEPAITVVEFVVNGLDALPAAAAFVPGLNLFSPGSGRLQGSLQLSAVNKSQERLKRELQETAGERRDLADRLRRELGGTPDGLRARLQAIGREQEPLTAALLSGDLAPDAFAQKRGDFDRLQREKASIEARLHALDEQKRKAEEYAKIAAKARAEIDHYKAMIAIAAAGGNVQVVPLDKEVGAAFDRKLDFESRQFTQGLQAESETMRGEVDGIKKQLAEAKKIDEFRVSALQRQGRLEEQLIKARTGAGGERQAIEQTYRLRLDYAQKEFDITKDRARFLESTQEAEIQHITDVTELERRRFDRMQNSIENLFDAMLSRSRSVGDAIYGIFQTAVLAPVKTAFSTWLTGMLMAGGGNGSAGGGGLRGALNLGGLLGGSIAAPGLGGFGIPGAPGGTPGFAGPVQGLGNLGIGSVGFRGLGGLLSTVFNSGSIAVGGGAATTAAGIGGPLGSLAGVASSPAAGLLGGLLAFSGLKRGGIGGALMSTGGGALAGFALGASIGAIGGPLGLAIGAGVGAAAGLIRSLFKSATEKVREKIRAVYNVDIRERNILEQIAGMAKEGFGGNLDLAIRSQAVRDLVELYAMTFTGRSAGLSSAPRPVNVYQSGGQIYQSPSTYSAPAAGGITVVMPVQVVGAREFLTQETHTVIAKSGRQVQNAALSAQRSNVGRRQAAALQLAPNLIT